MTLTKRLFVCLVTVLMLFSSGLTLAEETPKPEDAEAPVETATPLIVSDTALSAAEIPGTITNDCQLTLPEKIADKASRLLDDYVDSYLPLTKDDELLVEMPERAQGLYLEWYELSTAYSVEELNASGSVIKLHEAQPFINTYFELQEDTRALKITAHDKCTLSSLRLYAMDAELPDDVQRWQAPHEQADLVFLAATPEAAIEDLFAALCIYTVEHEVQTAIVCMSADTRAAQHDLLAALWRLGIERYPYFGGFFTWNNKSYKMLGMEWKAAATQTYIESILTALRPRVLVTHANDKDARNQAKYYTAEQLLNLAERKKTLLVDSGLEKLYLCAGEGTALGLDAPLINLDGVTAREAVEDIAFSLFDTLRNRPLGVHAQATFALSYTNVGEDQAKDDLLENINLSILVSYALPTPTPVPTPEPTDTPSPTATPEPVEPSPQNGEAGRHNIPAYLWALPAGGLLLSAIVCLLVFRKPFKRRSLPGRIVVSLLPLLLCLIVFLLLWLRPSLLPISTTPTPLPTMTASPEPADTPEPEPEEEEPPAAVEEAAADEDAAYYMQPGDPDEVVVTDAVNGHWEYRTDQLSIIINRFVTEYTTNAERTYQNVYFVAEIRMREVNAFRTGQAGERRNGLGAVHPYLLARREQGVLLITGDNLIMNDKAYKGILIRGGKFIADPRGTDTMAMYPDMTMRIFRVGETTADELLADGVRDAISFGPTLMRDGVLQEDVDKFRGLGDERNPRVGLGMVEPGHFVAIVVDGRQSSDNYSYGMSLSKFAELFVDYGCVEVYNLDGGVSAAMVFMGEQINRHADRKEGGYAQSFQRRIPDGLIWGYSTLVPSEDDPVNNKGTNIGGQNLLPTPTP